jgi:hypothetical protein
MHRDVAHQAFRMAQRGALAGMSEQQLTELLGPPTWRREHAIIWDLHPHVWDGRIILWDNGTLAYSHDQGGAL